MKLKKTGNEKKSQISRRNFIKTSALGLAAAGSTPLAS
ncbi:twin-arginine translocation signal domain-containing protein, partial [Burkholderia ubonensis]